MTTHRPASTPATQPEQLLPGNPVAAVSRRSVLKAAAAGGATVVVAGTGVLSYRVFDNGGLVAHVELAEAVPQRSKLYDAIGERHTNRGPYKSEAVPADALTLDAQGMSPVILSIAKLLPVSSRAAGDRFWVAQTRDVHTKTAAAYGVITVTDPYDVATQLIGGRLLQRIHLTDTADSPCTT